jgi:hypothetical protein
MQHEVIDIYKYIYRSDKKILHQMTDLMKRKHQLRLIELEESVLFAQVNIDSFCFYLK